MAFQRDPVSALFDVGARRLLARAYDKPGEWVTTRLQDPDPVQVAWGLTLGILLPGRDAPSAAGGRGGGLNARTRWARSFVRCLYYQHKWYSTIGSDRWRAERRAVPRAAGALEIEVGARRLPARGVIPAGREISVRLMGGGKSARRAVHGLADDDRIFADNGEPAGRWSDPQLRDW